jgi:hypothetical protein
MDGSRLMDDDVKAALETERRRREDLEVQFQALELDFQELRGFFLAYLINERAALMSVAKFAEARAMDKKTDS